MRKTLLAIGRVDLCGTGYIGGETVMEGAEPTSLPYPQIWKHWETVTERYVRVGC